VSTAPDPTQLCLTQMVELSQLSRVGRCYHTLKLLEAICTEGTYSHHYAYSVHIVTMHSV